MKTTYTQIPDWLACRTEEKINGDAKILYSRLVRFGNKSGIICPEQLSLARELGLSDRTIRRHIAALAEYKLIEIVRRGHGISNSYSIVENHTWKTEWLAKQPHTENEVDQPAQATEKTDIRAETLGSQQTAAEPTAVPPSSPAPSADSSDILADEIPEDVAEIFDYCMKVTDRTDKLDPAARMAIERALKSHAAGELKAVAYAASKSAWHQGENNSRRRFDNPSYIFKDEKTMSILLNSPTSKSSNANVAKSVKVSALERTRADNKDFLRKLYPQMTDDEISAVIEKSKNWLDDGGRIIDVVAERVYN